MPVVISGEHHAPAIGNVHLDVADSATTLGGPNGAAVGDGRTAREKRTAQSRVPATAVAQDEAAGVGHVWGDLNGRAGCDRDVRSYRDSRACPGSVKTAGAAGQGEGTACGGSIVVED